MDTETQGYNGARPVAGRQVTNEFTGNTGRVGGDKAQRQGGLYRHPQSGAEIIAQIDPFLGDGQARAAERAGFVFVRDVNPDEVKELGAPSAEYSNQPERAVDAQKDELASLRARLASLEAQEDRRKNEEATGNPVPGTEPVIGADSTKETAAERTELQTGIKVDTKTGDVEDEKDYELEKLRAEAKELHVDARGSKETLTQRVAKAKAEKESK